MLVFLLLTPHTPPHTHPHRHTHTSSSLGARVCLEEHFTRCTGFWGGRSGDLGWVWRIYRKTISYAFECGNTQISWFLL